VLPAGLPTSKGKLQNREGGQVIDWEERMYWNLASTA